MDDGDAVLVWKCGPSQTSDGCLNKTQEDSDSDIPLIGVLIDACSSLTTELAAARAECDHMRASVPKVGRFITIYIISTLEDSMSLKDCGHTFCVACLAKALRMNFCDHVEHRLDSNRPTVTDNAVTEHEIMCIGRSIRDMMFHQLPLPEYRCPKCRSNISSKPIPAFVVQQLLDDISKLSQDLMPRVACRTPQGIDQLAGNIDAVWDAFFSAGQVR
ncbi:hypothetical protein DEU56DRAFT_757319 [Suillus clintonianus]|uniref:uncharacterized protein n=1 Tax=Suillus clintonianus TaxID=1904413 RepID=UPI001B87F97C|nr:uncharacterized protein DEU56DRAFT_757319 [Suillus clintonianus]KAG2132331.1 hypothetical protein DEU56DRAFT_757319 [Suillus clintonianus]